MIEKDIVTRKLTALEEYLNDLTEIKVDINWTEFSNNKIIRRYVERTLQMAAEACLDIANHIISYEGYREPSSNKDAFNILVENKVLDNDLGEKLIKMAKFRNIIVHDYLRIETEIVYAILTKDIEDLSKYAVKIKSHYL